MITAIQSKGLVRFVVEMKNFIPRWLHFVPRFPQAKRTLEMCQFPQRRWPLLRKRPKCSAKVSKYSFKSSKLRRNAYVRKYLNAQASFDWSGRADLNLSRFACVSEAGARRRNPERSERRISRPRPSHAFVCAPALRCGASGLGVLAVGRTQYSPDICYSGIRGEWSGRADLNCRPLAPQASALPG